METIYRRCCGLDVHKGTIRACVRLLDERGELATEVRSFPTMTADLLRLGDWLAGLGVTHAAMERSCPDPIRVPARTYSFATSCYLTMAGNVPASCFVRHAAANSSGV